MPYLAFFIRYFVHFTFTLFFFQLLTNGFSDHLKSFKPRPAVVNMNSVIGEYNFDYSKIKRSHSQRLRHSSTSSLGGGAPVVTASD